MPALLFLTGPQAGLRFEIAEEVVMGRSPSCSIALDDAKVSRRHARFAAEGDEVRVSDLQSRNGTTVNGERLESELALLPGDRIQVGDSTILFEPGTAAALVDLPLDLDVYSSPVEELLPVTGVEAGLYNTGIALLASTSEAMALRRAAQELARCVNAEVTAALLGSTEGLLTASVVGAKKVDVPRSLMRGALDRKEAGRVAGMVCAPLLASGGAPFGILYAERPEPFGDIEVKTIAALGRLVGEALTLLRSRGETRDEPAPVGSSRPIRNAIAEVRRAAVHSEPIVLVGEEGVGRDVLAKYLHFRSARALGPFVVVDCRRSAQELDERIFGRTSGPGVPPSPAALLMADGGTLLLSHLDSFPRQLSSRLVKHLAHQTAPSRQGGEEAVNVRVIATISVSLGLAVSRGDIDVDLAKILNSTSIEVPALRDRKGDITILIDHFFAVGSLRFRKPKPTLSPDALRLLSEYAWPGNVAELQTVVERFSMLYSGSEITTLQLPPELRIGNVSNEERQTLGQRVAQLERDSIVEALREAAGKKIKAAELLGISRPTLDKKIEEYQLTVEKRRL
jgi:DNA-binding NtrC family response regulator